MNKTTSIIIGLVIGVALGYLWGATGVTASYAAKIEAVNKLFPIPAQIFSVTGKVKQVTSSSIVLEGVAVSSNPFAGDFPTTREVVITNTTKITRMTSKDARTLQSEMAEFQKKLQESKGRFVGTPPAPFGQVDIQLADIKVGDMVIASAAGDILKAASFPATTVQLTAAAAK